MPIHSNRCDHGYYRLHVYIILGAVCVKTSLLIALTLIDRDHHVEHPDIYQISLIFKKYLRHLPNVSNINLLND